MIVQILQTVEDANEFPADEPLAVVQPYTIAHRSYKWHIARVDKLLCGEIADLPDIQAKNLINMGYAEEV